MSESETFTDAMLIPQGGKASTQSSPDNIDVVEAMLWGCIPEDEFFLVSETPAVHPTLVPVQA
jgi:hypothetical protein